MAKNERDAVIVSAVRTAIARQGGALASLDLFVYGAEVIKEAVKRANVTPEMIDDVVFGNVLQGGGNIARVTALQTGLSLSIPGLTVDRQCGSALNAINVAAQAIKAGAGDVYVAGGAESMTRAPYMLDRPERAYSPRPPRFRPSRLAPDEVGNPPMGVTAENLAEKYNISREEQDEYAARSQERMSKAIEGGYFDEQIVPISVPQRRGEPVVFDKDEHPRPGTTVEALSKLPAVFKQDGTVTAGTSSGLNDAASALVIMSRAKAEELGLEIMAVVRDYTVAGCDPNIMGIGPVPATEKILERTGLKIEDFDFVLLNEAFAAQVLACNRELEIDPEKLNPLGGAIAQGHPLGATGAILATQAVYEMKRGNHDRVLVTACIGGGQGIATVLERD